MKRNRNKDRNNENSKISRDIRISKETRKISRQIAIEISEKLNLNDNNNQNTIENSDDTENETSKAILRKVQNMQERRNAEQKEKKRYNEAFSKCAQWRESIKINQSTSTNIKPSKISKTNQKNQER